VREGAAEEDRDVVAEEREVCGLGVGAFASSLIGGVTGDVYGATAEITEALTLLFIAAMANRGWLDAWLLA
jgi:hypothetical protein